MCRPSANTENSRRTREKPLVPRVQISIVGVKFYDFNVCRYPFLSFTNLKRLMKGKKQENKGKWYSGLPREQTFVSLPYDIFRRREIFYLVTPVTLF